MQIDIEAGIYPPEELTNEQYHAIPAVSKSDLDKIDRSPAHYKFAKDNPQPPTTAMIRGTIVHAAILEPDRFEVDYAPEFDAGEYPDALRSLDDIKNACIDYNNGLYARGVKSAGELREIIDAYNESLPQPIKGRSNQDKIDALLAAAGDKHDAESLAGMSAKELRAVVDDHNEALPKPVSIPRGATRADILEALEAVKPELYREQMRLPAPLPLDGTKQELISHLSTAAPDVEILDKLSADYYAARQGAQIIPRSDFELYLAMRDAALAHKGAAYLLGAGGVREYSIIAQHPETGALVKCRPDLWLQEQGIFVDVKTTDDARPASFAKSCANFRYDVQAAWYSDVSAWAGVQVSAFVFIAIESKPPHGVAVYVAGPRMTARGRYLYQGNFETLVRCRQAGEWPGYADTIEPLELPAWADRIVDELNLLEV